MKEKEKFCLSKKVFYILFSLILISTLLYLYTYFLNYLNKNKLAKNPKASVKNQDKIKKPLLIQCGRVNQVCCANNYCDQSEGLTACINGKCLKLDKLNPSEALSQGFKCGDYDQPCCLEKIDTEKLPYNYKKYEKYYQLKCKENLVCNKNNKIIKVDPLKTNEENVSEIMKEVYYSICKYDEKKVCGSTNQPCCGTAESDPRQRCVSGNYCFLNLLPVDFNYSSSNICLPNYYLDRKLESSFRVNDNKLSFSIYFPLDYYKIEAVISCNNKKISFYNLADQVKNYDGKILIRQKKDYIEGVLFDGNQDECDLINNYKKIKNNKLPIKLDINVYSSNNNIFFTKTIGNYLVDVTPLLPLLKKLEQAKISPTITYYSPTKFYSPTLKLTPTPTKNPTLKNIKEY